MSAFTYNHDDEAGRGRLTLHLERMERPGGFPGENNRTFHLTQDEAIELYELLRAYWAGYVAERDEAQAAVARGATLGQYLDDWRHDIAAAYADFGHPFDDPDLERDIARGK